MAAMYAVYHGSTGVKAIAYKVHSLTSVLKSSVESMGYTVTNTNGTFFDTLTLDVSGAVQGGAEKVHQASLAQGINLRKIDEKHVGVTLDESVSATDLVDLINVFAAASSSSPTTLSALRQPASSASGLPSTLIRTSPILPHPVFNKYHSETEMLRYLHHLQSKDLSLVHSMVSLGSCTMKLNSTSAMIPLTLPGFSKIHPFAPADQATGYAQVIKELEDDLCRITGFAACSLQPNSGAAGEYAGLSVIRAYHESRGESHRDTCLIPLSAHGTNPAVRFPVPFLAFDGRANIVVDI